MKNIVKKIFTAVLFSALIGLAPMSVHAQEKIKNISIEFVDGGPFKTSEAQVRNVLPIKPGDILTPEAINTSLDYLRKWGLFETINTSISPSAEGADLKFILKESVLVGEIAIEGNYPFVAPRVKKYLTIRPGDMYTHERIQDQLVRIEEFYEREGFYNTDVSVKEKWDEVNNDVLITFKIKRGELVRYGQIDITGMKAYPTGRLISAINPLRRYKQRQLNDAMRSVAEFYHRHGYPKARISIVNKDLNLDTRRFNVTIAVKEGPHVALNFEGNHHVSTKKLRKGLTIAEASSFDDYELELSTNNIKKILFANGFPDGTASYKKKQLPNGDYEILFTINEGLRRRIFDIEVTDNRQISDSRLKNQMRNKEVGLTENGAFDEEILHDDIKKIEKYYNSQGYLNAKVQTPIINNVREGLTIEIPVEENQQTIVDEINFNGLNELSKHFLLKKIKNRVQKPFDPDSLEEDKKALLLAYADSGFPYAEVKYSVANKDNKATIDFDIVEGTKVTIGEILVIGNSLTRTKAILKAMPIKKGKPFSYQKISDSQLALRRLGAFNTVNIETIGINEKNEQVNLRVKVEEQKPLVLDFELGYSTNTGLTGTMLFNNYNSFGIAKRSTLRLTGGRELSRGEASWTDPRFLGTDLEMAASSWLQYADEKVYTYVQGGGGFGFFRRFHRTGLTAKWELMRNYFVKGSSTAADANSLRDSTISKITLSGSFDTRNNFANPSKGIFAMAGSDIYNEIRGREANFVKFRTTFGVYQGFWDIFVFSNDLRFDRIETIGTDVSVPTNELLLLGGDDTIRGFARNSLGPTNAAGKPVGGRTRGIYNSELRMKVIGNIQLAGFFDAAFLVNNFADINGSTIRRSAGAGLRYITPVGPLRFDYGIILDRKPGESFGRFHFTFGYVF